MSSVTNNSNNIVELHLDDRIKRIETSFDADAFSMNGPILYGLDDLLRDTVERKDNKHPEKRAVVILTTMGGFIEVVARMVDTIRKHYKNVEFIIPNYAYSAGTVFVMSGDAIHMDYYSRLGPIDPQVTKLGESKMVPALGYLERYNDLIEKANSGIINTAEIQLLLDFDQAELYQYEQQRELSIKLLKDWLCDYKFKNWKKTESKGKTVTNQMKVARATSIAKTLNNTKKWHIHGYGISMDVLETDLKLKIDEFGADKDKSEAIRDYDKLLSDYMVRLSMSGSIHVAGRFNPIYI